MVTTLVGIWAVVVDGARGLWELPSSGRISPDGLSRHSGGVALRYMRGIHAPVPGGLEALVWVDRQLPVPSSREVVLKVMATAVNRADLLQRQGFYPPPPGASDILGLECVGEVSAVGDDVQGWRVGDVACALLVGGGYATDVVVDAGQLLEVPEGCSPEEACSLVEVGCTVWSNLVMVAGLVAGQTVLVHGGAGGIGTMAIQVAKALGAEVVTTVGSAEKAEFCRSLGADHTVLYRSESYVDVVKDVTGGRGADVVLDIMGAKYLAGNVASLATGGTLVVIGLQGGVKGEINLGAVVAKRLRLVGTSLRSRPAAEKQEIVQAVRDNLWPLVAAGKVKPIIDSVLPLSQVAAAHERMAGSSHTGKIVLTTTEKDLL